MDNLQEFFAMGGYAFYVWSSYFLTTVVLVGVVLWSARQFRQTQAKAFQRAKQNKKRHDS